MEGASLHASLIGATIGNYKVVAKLGEGGMGSVYLAEHPLIGKKVALKVLHEEYSANTEVVGRFFNEAKAVNDIGHPNIVDIIDYGVVQTPTGPGFVYFIMEFLAGEALSTVIQRDSPIPPDRALHIASQVADCLSASHAKGIIHRDLKPDNIFLIQRQREKDFVKVLDFGIAKLTGNDGKSSRTRTGIVMGTPAYMSPEQCEGRGNIDHRTDIYALGIVLYEMITGKVPFAGEGYGEVLVQHLTKTPARPSTIRGVIPPHVEAIVMKALEKKPADRFQNMDQMLAALKDPIGYVDANGGITAFYPSDTPPPGPQAGQATMIAVKSPAGPQSQPGLMQNPQRPTTLTAGAGQIGEAMPVPTRSRMPLIIGAAVGSLALIGGGVFFATRGGDEKKDPVVQAGVTTPEQPVKAPDPEPVKPEPVKAPDPEPVKPEIKTVEVPVAPKKVKISVSSVPPGAEVRLAGETVSRGVTPHELELDRGDSEVEIVLKAEGYKEKRKKVKTRVDAMIEITLEKARSSTDVKKDPKKDRKKGPADDDDVLAPSFD